MKKAIFIVIIIVTSCCPKITIAQQATVKAQRDSLQLLFDDALVMLDSLAGINIQFTNELEQVKSQLATTRKELITLLKEKNETQTVLTNAKKIISDQNATIEKLEAEIKRLSQPKKPQ